jgi:hypothetical protein
MSDFVRSWDFTPETPGPKVDTYELFVVSITFEVRE